MDGSSAVSAIVAKQWAYLRHAPIMQEATPFTEEMLSMSLVACFEQQVTISPRRLAVVSAEGSLTYDELNQAANRLAHHLLAHGVAVGVPTAIILGSGLDVIVSMLAVLKTGGYYLVLEPDLPPQRVQDILNLAATQMILTTSSHADYSAQVSPKGGRLVLLDQMDTESLIHNPDIHITPLQPSRLGFTSGSTGAPKPSLKTHKNYLYGVWQGSNTYLFSRDDRHASVYRFSTGPSMRALYSALLIGGSIHLHPDLNYDMRSWATWIDAQAITQLYMPTATFRELLHNLPEGPNFPSIRMVYVAGQTIYRQDAEMFQRYFSRGAILVSRFSMSETSCLAHYLVDHETRFDRDTLPIGYALPGRELLIVSEEGQPLGFNQPGEIAVRRLFQDGDELEGSSSGLNGVHAANDRTEPFFRTSDLGLMRPDGCLIHLGRKDDTVKVRGNRVALAEAESLLLKVKGVAQAAVKSFSTVDGDNQLVGYVALSQDAQLTATDLRRELGQMAPTYMIPARFLVMPTLPLTTTGKIDRQALPAPGNGRPLLSFPLTSPVTPFEEIVSAIWCAVLGLDAIGIHDPFLELGGNSLQAMRIAARVQEEFGVEIPLAELFAASTVAEMALAITSRLVASAAWSAEFLESEELDVQSGLGHRFGQTSLEG